MNGFGLYFITSGEANIILDIGQKKYRIGKLKVKKNLNNFKKGDIFG